MTVALQFRHYPGEGRPLLILHGLFGSARNWHSQAARLGESHDVYALDLRNHGGSPHTDTMSYPEMAADVLGFMDRQRLDSARVLGHSMGGKVAMQLALGEPARVQRLIVVDIAPRRYPRHHDAVLDALRDLEPSQHASRQAVDEALAATITDETVRRFVLTNLVRTGHGGLAWQLNLASIAADYEAIAAAPEGDTPYRGETLFIKGALSDYIQAADQAPIARLFPQARARIIAGAGHWPHAEKPDAFAQALSEFLAG